jgi:excinuclease ABC subunit A
MAPLVIARKGIYKELADWAVRHGWFVLRVDGEPVETRDWPRLDRYREHSIDLPVGEIAIRPEQENALRALLDQALDLGKGAIRVVEVVDGTWGAETPYSTRRACPSCGIALPEPDPRLFSFNSKQGWCGDCFGTGLALRGFDGSSRAKRINGRRPTRSSHSPARAATAHASTRRHSRCAFASARSPTSRP